MELDLLAKQAVEIVVKKNKEAAVEIIEAVVLKLIEQMIADSPNKMDDALLMALKPQLLDLIDKLKK